MKKTILLWQNHDAVIPREITSLKGSLGIGAFYGLTTAVDGLWDLYNAEASPVMLKVAFADIFQILGRKEGEARLLRIVNPKNYKLHPEMLREYLRRGEGNDSEYTSLDTAKLFLYDLIIETFQLASANNLEHLKRPLMPTGRLNYLQAGITPHYFTPDPITLQHYLIDSFDEFYPRPRAAALDISMTCNLKCTKCFFHGRSSQKLFESKKSDEQLLIDDDQFYRLADQMLAYEPNTYFVFSNAGEPLLHPQAVSYVEYIKSKGGRVQITTNATRLIPEVALRLVDLEVDQFMVNFGAMTRDSYERTHIGGNFEKTKNQIDTLINLIAKRRLEHKVKVNMHFVLENGNRAETEDYVDYWIRQAPIVSVHQLNAFSSYAKYDAKFFEPQDRFPCQVLWTSYNVHNNGDFLYCCCWNRDNPCGNIYQSTLSDLWTDAKIKSVRQGHVHSEYSIISQCENCENWMALPRPYQMTESYYVEIDPVQKVYYRLN